MAEPEKPAERRFLAVPLVPADWQAQVITRPILAGQQPLLLREGWEPIAGQILPRPTGAVGLDGRPVVEAVEVWHLRRRVRLVEVDADGLPVGSPPIQIVPDDGEDVV